MREVFHQSLEDLQSRLVEIAELVTVSIDKATRAFATSDVALAEEVIADDAKIDELAVALDEQAIEILARQQPVARDRLLSGEDLDGLLVQRDGELVDLRVVGDDLLGQRDVARGERAGRLVDGDRDELGDLDEAGLQVLEGLVEDFAHGGRNLSFGSRLTVQRGAAGRPRGEHCARAGLKRLSAPKVNERCPASE